MAESKTTTPKHDNALPLELLPEGWRLYRLGWCGTEGPYQAIGWWCNLVKTFRTSGENIHAKGCRTPRSAFLSALEKIHVEV
jgi:hypothetical protein